RVHGPELASVHAAPEDATQHLVADADRLCVIDGREVRVLVQLGDDKTDPPGGAAALEVFPLEPHVALELFRGRPGVQGALDLLHPRNQNLADYLPEQVFLAFEVEVDRALRHASAR